MAKTRQKMDKFLDSFDDTVTIWAGDASHKSIDHLRGSEAKATVTPYSVLTRADMSPEAWEVFDGFKRNGYHVMPNMFSPEELTLLQNDSRRILDDASFGDNEFYGRNTKRSYALLRKTRSLDAFLTNPTLVQLVDAFFAPNALLSGAQLIEIFPGEKAQKLHYDQQFINLGNQTRGDDILVNFLIAVDDFTEENGATVVIPGSHTWPQGRTPTSSDERKKLVMKAGSVVPFSSSLWHGGGENSTNLSRRAIVVLFIQPWLRPIENHFLSIPFSLAATLPPKIQSFLGYSLHHPFLGLVDFQHPHKKLIELAKEEDEKRQILAKL